MRKYTLKCHILVLKRRTGFSQKEEDVLEVWRRAEELAEVFEKVEVLRRKDYDLSHGNGAFDMHYRAQGVGGIFLSIPHN